MSGVSSTFVGYPGLPGYFNATGGAARFNSPRGLALDSSGNLYVADNGNHSIRMVTAGGVVTTLAGTGSFGSSNATGTAAEFNSPIGLAFDASSNALYVADSLNRVIRQITLPGAVVTTFAGTMGATDYTFTASEHGTHTFIITLKRSGLQSVTLTDTLVGSITGTGDFNVSAGAATSLSVEIASSVASGAATEAIVTAKDTYGSTADGYLGTIHFTSSDGLATLPSDSTFVSGDLGVKNFVTGVTLRTAGAQSVSSTDVADAGITGTANTTVSPAAPSGLTATRSGSQIQLSWTAPPGVIANYDVVRASPTSSGWAFLTTVSGTAHLDTTASPGTAYAYKVLARIGSGASSPYSVPDAGTTGR